LQAHTPLDSGYYTTSAAFRFTVLLCRLRLWDVKASATPPGIDFCVAMNATAGSARIRANGIVVRFHQTVIRKVQRKIPAPLPQHGESPA
jgi:hypothetical protein